MSQEDSLTKMLETLTDCSPAMAQAVLAGVRRSCPEGPDCMACVMTQVSMSMAIANALPVRLIARALVAAQTDPHMTLLLCSWADADAGGKLVAETCLELLLVGPPDA